MNTSPIIKSADYECGGVNATKFNFFQQQLMQMNVKNVEAEVRFKYNDAKDYQPNVDDGVQGSFFKDAQETAGGIGTIIKQAGTNAGLLCQAEEYNHLVSFIRQEWDSQLQTYQYQLQSYSSFNQYFIIDIGRKLGEKPCKQSAL
jgi:hypothetical protein